MRRAALLALVAVIVSLAVAGGWGARSADAATPDLLVASESYYRADVAPGTLTVRVEAHIQNASSRDVAKASIWLMSGATGVEAQQEGVPLSATTTPGDASLGLGRTELALVKPLKPGAKANLIVTYAVAAQAGERVNLAAGALEAMFVSQGPGSFVFVDVPRSADTYFEPGCVRVAAQPEETKAGGFERWVCGEAALVALYTDHPEIIERCARLDDSCRQRGLELPFAGFVQSFTDPNLRGTMEADLPLARGNVKLSLRYMRRDQEWAAKQFAIAKEALPKLEAAFGFPYPRETLLMRESTFLTLAGALGVAFPDLGEVLLTNTGAVDREVTVHELAHQWAGSNLAAPWLWEGLAEYGMRTVAPSLGLIPSDRHWQSLGYTDNLATWYESSTVRNPDYWYGKAGAFWFAYQQAVGGSEVMRSVLALTAAPPEPRDVRWFMDAGERATGANLDALFQQWVFPETAKPLLADRRAARTLVAALATRSAAMGIIGNPEAIESNLASWQFGPIAGQVEQANRLLDAYTTLYVEQQAAGLPETDRFGRNWSSESLTSLDTLVQDQRLAMSAIVSARSRLQGEAPTSPGATQLASALDTYATGNFSEAKRLASSAITAAANASSAAKMIEIARAKQATFEPSILARVGLLLRDPDGDLEAAEAAQAAGDGRRALDLSRSAYDTWDGAAGAGLVRLALCAALLSAASVAAWWYRRRRAPSPPAASRPTGGHSLGEHRSSWRDWENS